MSPMLSEGPCFVFDNSKRKDNLLICSKWYLMKKAIKHIINCRIFKYKLTLVYMFQREAKKREIKLELRVWRRLREVFIYSYLDYAYKSVIRASLSKMLELKPESKMKFYKTMSKEPQNIQ